MINNKALSLTALQANIKRLLWIRLIVFLCQLTAVVIALKLPGIEIRLTPVILILLVYVAYNLCLLWYLQSGTINSDNSFMLHLLADVLYLFGLLYFTGGASNPFVSYFLVPITISAAVLPWNLSWLLTAVSLLCYSFLLFFYEPLPMFMPMPDMTMGEQSGLNFHVLGMWFNFLVSAGLITYFVVKMAMEIRVQEEKLNLYREHTLRDEQIMALATQAAGTAHELGTPLSSMAVLLGEMLNEYKDDKALGEQVDLLQQQVQRCRAALQKLSRQGDYQSLVSIEKHDFSEYIKEVLDQWHLLRPQHDVKVDNKLESKTIIECDTSLAQAILNMLDNAADASELAVEITLHDDESNCYLDIRDHGEGLEESALHNLGKQRFSTKQDGLGVGLLLGHATVNRLGGGVSMFRHQQQGTVTRIKLPKAGDHHGQ